MDGMPDENMSDPLTREAIAEYLGGCLFLPERYSFFPSLDSTNTWAARMAAEGAPEGSVVVADGQTLGRGRLGRVWESPPGVNLYFSMILRPRVLPQYSAQMTLITGLALAEAVRGLGVQGVEIKWPNDLLLDGGKLAGILTEMAGEVGKVHYVVVGVGVNVNGEPESYSMEIQPLARSLRGHLQKTVKRAPLLADFLLRFAGWYDRYLREGFAPIREAWVRDSGICGKQVRVNLMEDTFSGEAVDMDREGFLLVRCPGEHQLRRVIAGDIRLL